MLRELFVKSFERRFMTGKEVFGTPRRFSPIYLLLVDLNYLTGLILEGKEEAKREYLTSVKADLENYYPIEGKSIYYHEPLRRFPGLDYAPKRLKHLWGLVKDYAPVLFYDFDFDWVYILKLLRVKLQRTSDALKRGHLVSSERHSLELKRLVFLIDRILADDYDKISRERLDAEYGELEHKSEPTDNPNLNRMILDRPLAREGSLEYLIESKKSMKMFKDAERQKQADIDYLFDTMKKKLQGWWD